MVDYKTKYLDAKEKIEILAFSITDDKSIDDFRVTVDEKIKNFKPSLMLYGTYNSGKSTLLNALYGEEEKAKTGDWPETCEITAYDWNGYTIYDTPGIDAPQEHDELTQEHLDKTEIVLFIVSNDGAFEEDYIYEKLADIVSVGKPLVLILNNKTGADELELNQAIISMNKKLIEIGERRTIHNIETKVQVLFVDAQAALDGKTQNELLLIEDSNIQSIEYEIDKLFRKSGMSEVIANLNRYVEQYIDKLIENVNSKVDNELVKELEKQITAISNENIRNVTSIKRQIEKESEHIGNDVKALLLSGETENVLNDFVSGRIDEISIKINLELECILKDLQEYEEAYIDSLKKINLEIDNVSALESKQSEDDNMSADTSQHLKDIGEYLKKGITDEKVVSEGTKKVLLKLREWGAKGFKGKWEKTLGKTADKVGKWAGPAVRVAMAGYDIYNSEREHEKMLQQKREYTQSAQNEANKLTHSINESVSSQLGRLLSDIYTPVIDNKRNIINKLTDQNSEYSEINDKLISIKLEFI